MKKEKNSEISELKNTYSHNINKIKNESEQYQRQTEDLKNEIKEGNFENEELKSKNIVELNFHNEQINMNKQTFEAEIEKIINERDFNGEKCQQYEQKNEDLQEEISNIQKSKLNSENELSTNIKLIKNKFEDLTISSESKVEKLESEVERLNLRVKMFKLVHQHILHQK